LVIVVDSISFQLPITQLPISVGKSGIAALAQLTALEYLVVVLVKER